ncbi:MAG: FAD-dependent oxidoreductase [Richelia sp. SM1_7_0]|nr:FAD-dependent oxidoreductase [Richelia sp. SM1_7_0]
MPSLECLKTLHLKTPVTGIKYQDGKPVVCYIDPVNGKQSKPFEAVIVATSNRSMELMGLTTDSDAFITQQPVKVALRNLHLSTSSKLFIRTKTKFWQDENGKSIPDIPQNIQTDELPRGVYALDYPQNIILTTMESSWLAILGKMIQLS